MTDAERHLITARMLSLFSLVWFALFIVASVIAYGQWRRADESAHIGLLQAARSLYCEPSGAANGPATGH